jgi:hypothetical protein
VREHVVRSVGPSLAIIVEVEAPIRIALFARGPDEERLYGWIEERCDVAALVSRAAELVEVERGRAWTRELARPDGVSAFVAHLLRMLPPE